ncbi:family 2 encapsulin nanocompartment cargo protein polyprenyl transferase [Streptomyces sp. SL13]|uniref:Family 2 encapsulin nanocompartment cargo protein polyprenyl transferase n=1 Tax=Streptantibioticus silvisoli TaxID=2705255 RepID=A0AA90HDI1_9ACTN|nr:family 2 encapsulin nanocompartment cargo protein polyprenyl transferase [Streptantibioticus silvisoli]MDI5967455.1 family 2 encapsulin nanocompartment cargo protein polyprenyl transferase [Streptantibioticus silvisoli]MDI5974387.1 family 2 encapsulin nanocompartment cargo protein polyprenyl transferase [Streptantibioticus silvisoli]
MGIFTLDREGLDREGHEAAAVLGRARGCVDPALRTAVASLPRSMRRIAAYHFGWQDAGGAPATGDGGKAIRPALVLAAAQALGGTAESAVPAAAAVELVHNFTLLHDDVLDHDPTRRHRPTAWTVFGVPDAILAGDALQSLALRVLALDPHPAAARAVARLAACVIELCDGQHADCSFERRGDVSLAECLAMAEAKTGALLGCACALGALYAGAPQAAVEAMDAFGRRMGLAFQLIDDLIGIWGDPDVTGKPAGADLTARKKSLPVVAALRSGTPAGDRLAALYAGEQPLSDGQLREAAEAIELAGGRDWAQTQACDRMADAIGHLADAVPDGTGTQDLLALTELVTRRDR